MRMYYIISRNESGRGKYLDPVIAGSGEEAQRLFKAAHKERIIVSCRRAWTRRKPKDGRR